MLTVNISDSTIVTVKNVEYRCILHNINKSESMYLLQNFVLKDYGYRQKKILS